jgi:hypothetical protein
MAHERARISSSTGSRRVDIGLGHGSTKSTKICYSTTNNEGMLFSRPSSTTKNKYIWRNLDCT